MVIDKHIFDISGVTAGTVIKPAPMAVGESLRQDIENQSIVTSLALAKTRLDGIINPKLR